MNNTVNNAIRTLRNASHHELSAAIAELAGAVKANFALSQSCIDFAVDQLDNLADVVDGDLAQQIEELAHDNRQQVAA